MSHSRITEKRNYSTGIYVQQRNGKLVWEDAYDLVENERSDAIDDVFEHFAVIEDKIEQGTMIELPCPIGSKIYYVITSFRKNGQPSRKYYYVLQGKASWKNIDYVMRNWGKTIFQDRESAKKQIEKIKST